MGVELHSRDELSTFFCRNQAILSPRQLYLDKTLGRLPGSGRQLTFVDIGLLPFAEEWAGKEIKGAVEDAVGMLAQCFGRNVSVGQWGWICKTTFRLLAAKVLQDKGVPRFQRMDFANVCDVLQKVREHYGAEDGNGNVPASCLPHLEDASERFSRLGSLRNLTTEVLADVYEEACIAKKIRNELGIHSTPSYLVDYIIWQLEPWIERLDMEKIRVFEPACGHAPFLVGMMRLLRSMDLPVPRDGLSRFFRETLVGIERDPFALEIGRLSLTIADVPNPNGWRNVKLGNMFESGRLKDLACNTNVLLSNLPFQDAKALRVMAEALPSLPPGAVFGVIFPASLIFSKGGKPTEFRRWLTRNCQLAEVSLFPDGIFKFADQECALILGRRIGVARRTAPSTSTRCRRIREEEKEGFKDRFEFPSDRLIPQSRFAADASSRLWVAEYDDEIWSWLRDAPRLETIARVGQGFEHKGKSSLPKGTRLVTDKPFPGAVKVYIKARGGWRIDAGPALSYARITPDVIRCPLHGLKSGIPQVLMPRNPARGIWRCRPFIDGVGRPFASNFVTIRPLRGSFITLEYLWAIMCSPVTSAYLFTHTLKRNIQDGDLYGLPVPVAGKRDVERISRAVTIYLSAAREYSGPLLSGVDGERLHDLLRKVDAEVLRLYDLPARAETKLLSLFDSHVRPGVPEKFKSFYRPAFSRGAVPLYIYLSTTFTRHLKGLGAELSPAQQQRLDELEGKPADQLNFEEDEEVHLLRAEFDGCNYALAADDDKWLEAAERDRGNSQRKMSQIAELLMEQRLPRRS